MFKNSRGPIRGGEGEYLYFWEEGSVTVTIITRLYFSAMRLNGSGVTSVYWKTKRGKGRPYKVDR